VFDFILRNPSDCVVLFDEPELHLHPELSYKLLQTLSSIGKNNQFIFCTHSPEIITASLENSVVFLTSKKEDNSNQALIVNRDDETHHALNLLGQSIGIISLGKRILIIEGDEASLDKQTYGAILKNEFPDLILVPVGGKSSIKSFHEIRSS
jgi:energy-coupling factor transporter ATP-binding protein EcfA2